MLVTGMAAVGFAFAAAGVQAQTNTPPSQMQSTMPAQSQTKASRADQTFMKQAIQGDLAEVQMGRLAQQNGQSDAVKQFGQTLVSDHSANAEKAKQVAEQMGMTPPSEPSAKQQAEYKKMSKLSGAKFDREFAQGMVKDHKAEIAKFKKEAKKSGPVANFAKQTVPALEQHLQMAQSIEKKKQTTGSD